MDDYIESTAVANPHVQLRYASPKDEPRVFERVTKEMPKETFEIKPHPYGIELGMLMRLMKDRRWPAMLITAAMSAILFFYPDPFYRLATLAAGGQ